MPLKYLQVHIKSDQELQELFFERPPSSTITKFLKNSLKKVNIMIPKDFSRDNFTPDRLASAFTCFVWFNIEQRHGKPYHSWKNELYPVNSRLKVVAHASAFKSLKDMLKDFTTPEHKNYQPFTRAEIYENFFGTTLYIHDGIQEVKANETFKPLYITTDQLKQPGKHRLVDGFESISFGKIEISKDFVKKHLINNWEFYHANFNRIGKERTA